MRGLLLVGLWSAFLFGNRPLVRADTAASWRTFIPGYPPEAQRKNITGDGTVRVTTDRYGWVRDARMTHSTGSSLLDEATLKAARLYWQGPRDSTCDVPLRYQLMSTKAGVRKPPPSLLVSTPIAEYKKPSKLSGTIKVATDASGHVVRGVITQYSGSELLDENTMQFALKNWTGPRNTVYEVPVVYQFR